MEILVHLIFGTMAALALALRLSQVSRRVNVSSLERYNATDRHKDARKVRKTDTFSDDGASVPVQDQRQVSMPAGHGDLVDGDVAEVLGLGMAPRQVSLLDVLDQIPADVEVTGHIEDGHAPRQLQGVVLEALV